MNKEKRTTDKNAFPEEVEKMITGTEINWDKSKEQVWVELEHRIDNIPPQGKTILFRTWLKVGLAATVALLIGIPAILKFNVRTINIPAGQHAEAFLPDKSLVRLNAQSTITYKPFLWKYSRSVRFEGEAYFEVTRGSKFEVISGKGVTIVMGTSFNIYSRNEAYNVTCVSGRVKVSDISGRHEIILSPGQQAVFDRQGAIQVKSEADTEQVMSWIDNMFSFTSVPVGGVFEEIARQYGVDIKFPSELDCIYTGTFKRDSSIENALNLVCRPFDLRITRKSDHEFIVERNN
jgi:ferric-dicitrate binding protein FerR (iron transport regulator)